MVILLHIYIPFSIDDSFSDVQASNSTGITFLLCTALWSTCVVLIDWYYTTIQSDMQAFELSAGWQPRWSLSSLVQRMWCSCFPKRISKFDSWLQTDRRVFHFGSVHLVQRRWMMSTYGSFFARSFGLLIAQRFVGEIMQWFQWQNKSCF